METVYLVLQLTSEDYHGTYTEVVSAHSTREKARKKVEELYENSLGYNVEFTWEAYNIE